MATDLVQGGPEIIGTRINVYHLLPYFLDPTATEAQIAALYELTIEQVAAARAYVLNNPDTVLARHLEISHHFTVLVPLASLPRHLRCASTRWRATRPEASPTQHQTLAPSHQRILKQARSRHPRGQFPSTGLFRLDE